MGIESMNYGDVVIEGIWIKDHPICGHISKFSTKSVLGNNGIHIVWVCHECEEIIADPVQHFKEEH